jgi:hypothetical protein
VPTRPIGRVVALLEQQWFYCPPGAVEEIQQGVGTILNVTGYRVVCGHHDRLRDGIRPIRNVTPSIDGYGWRAESEKQWRDVLAVMKVQEGLLDLDYLRQWAEQLGLSELVEQLLEQASTEELEGR